MTLHTKRVTIRIYRCAHCRHEWEPRQKRAPKVCPACKRTTWNAPKIVAAVLLGLALCWPAHVAAQSPTTITRAVVALVAGHTADLSSTVYALHHGAHEANPLLPASASSIALVKGTVMAGDLALIWHLRHTHPRWAMGLALLSAGASGAATAHNLRRRQ